MQSQCKPYIFRYIFQKPCHEQRLLLRAVHQDFLYPGCTVSFDRIFPTPAITSSPSILIIFWYVSIPGRLDPVSTFQMRLTDPRCLCQFRPCHAFFLTHHPYCQTQFRAILVHFLCTSCFSCSFIYICIISAIWTSFIQTCWYDDTNCNTLAWYGTG